ncbi:MAG: rod-binding protein [Hyphomonadaceae bacterium]|nr:rod-binding protein [Hyphomonadaceae bacterium]
MSDGFITLPGAPLPLVSTPRPSTPAVPDEIRRTAEEFESVFLAEMLRPMFDGIETDGLGGGGIGEETFRPMLIDRYAEALSKSGGVGIADAIVRELLRMQGSAALPTEENVDGAAR